MAWYPMKTAKATSHIDKTYLSTDDPELMEIAHTLEVEVIERPDYLANDKALGEEAYFNMVTRRFVKDYVKNLNYCFCFVMLLQSV